MDPISALGLAANITQFVELGYTVCSNGYQLYKSKSGALIETQQRRAIADSLSDAAVTIDTSAAEQGEQPDSTIRRLCESCQQIAKQLLDVLNQLDVQSQGQKHRVWESALKSILSVWKEKDIREMERRIALVQTQLNTHLLTLLRLDKLVAQHEKLKIQNSIGLSDSKRDLSSVLFKSSKDTGRNISDNVQVNKAVKDSIIGIIADCERMMREQQVIGSLKYNYMTRRQHAVAIAHSHTFGWIFNDTNIGFNQWLTQGVGQFWISGKAGSGKSTLMKYICQNPITRQCLAQWAGNRPLIMASHFFWNAGMTELEKSQEGLLRSLLYEILRQQPNLMPLILPLEWTRRPDIYDEGSLNDAWQEWYLDELVQCFQELIKQDLSGVRFCFFIDGLDEYYGDHIGFANLLKLIATCTSIKFCLSSRPWNPFTVAFGQKEMPQIVLQDYTADDIERFIQGSLDLSPYCTNLHLSDTYKTLVNTITGRAQGVFLWVYLVIKSLIRGLTNGDSINYLLKRVEAFPRDLEAYFAQMLDNVEEIYQAHGAQFMLMCMTTTQPLPVLAVTFIDLEDEGMLLRSEITPWTESQTTAIVPELRRRLQAHCGDLLEISSATGDSLLTSNVNFLHRTVRDFLSDTKLYDLLCSRARMLPSTHKSLLMCALAQMKIAPRMFYAEFAKPLLETLYDICIYAAEHEENVNLSANNSLLDEVERLRSLHGLTSRPPVLISAIDQSVLLYTHYKIDREPELLSGFGSYEEYAPLDVALNGQKLNSFPGKMTRPNLAMLTYLLEKSASTDQKIVKSNIWKRHLMLLYRWQETLMETTDENKANRIGVIKLLLSHGADPDVEVEVDKTRVDTWSKTNLQRIVVDKPVYKTAEAVLMFVFNLLPNDPLIRQLDKCRAKRKSKSAGNIAKIWNLFS